MWSRLIRRWKQGSETRRRLAKLLRVFAVGMIILVPLNVFAEHFGWIVRHVNPNALTFILFGYAILLYVMRRWSRFGYGMAEVIISLYVMDTAWKVGSNLPATGLLTPDQRIEVIVRLAAGLYLGVRAIENTW